MPEHTIPHDLVPPHVRTAVYVVALTVGALATAASTIAAALAPDIAAEVAAVAGAIAALVATIAGGLGAVYRPTKTSTPDAPPGEVCTDPSCTDFLAALAQAEEGVQ